MLTRGETFVDQGQQRYEQQQRERSVAALKRRAAALGFNLTPSATLPSRPQLEVFLRRSRWRCA
jgi:transposase